ncbi:MAG: hypothetical protein JWP75_1344 [Frondihabitans sp.]|nr:hypothetical protein [Frondihabitans sp.]
MTFERIIRPLNDGWKFRYGDRLDDRWPGVDDLDWYDVGVPHSFGTPTFMETDFYVGYGSYRRAVDIDPTWIGRHLEITFHAVFQDAEIYLNGLLVGQHQGGYTAFPVDISDFVHAGDNLLFVRVDNLWNPRLAPRAGEHVFNGGIYRDVDLVVTNRVRIAWYGTSITTPVVTANVSTVAIDTEVVNDLPRSVTAVVTNTFDHHGVRHDICTEVILPAASTAIVNQSVTIPDPDLWHPDHPHLYALHSSIAVDNEIRDRTETGFGIRWFEFTADRGFFLNGETYDIVGANVHQDHAGWGDAVTHSGMRRDIAMVKEAGMNFIRGSHYPHHENFAAECDRQGVLFWSELPFWGMGGENIEGYWSASAYPIDPDDEADFERSCERTLEEMIRVNRNHPSVIVWSTGNEVFFSDDDVIEKARALTSRLADLAHAQDPSRPVAVGGAQRKDFDSLADIAGYNGDGASLFIDPGFPSMVSEYGSVVQDRPGRFADHFTDGVEIPRPWRSGIVLWCAFHHGSIAPGMGHMGFIDHHRLPLRSWYWYREHLTGVPAPSFPKPGLAVGLRIEADVSVVTTDGHEDAFVVVSTVDQDGTVISTAPDVTLTVTTGGGLFPTGRSMELTPRTGSFVDGRGAIEFRTYFSGTNIITATSPGLAPASLSISGVGGAPWADQPVRLQDGPPSRLGAPVGQSHASLARDRPVFASSFLPDHKPSNVTTPSLTTSWLSSDSTPGEWVTLDLEGPHDLQRVEIVSLGNSAVDYELLLSPDNDVFVLAGSGSLTGAAVTENLGGARTRFVRLRFPAAPCAIASISVYE